MRAYNIKVKGEANRFCHSIITDCLLRSTTDSADWRGRNVSVFWNCGLYDSADYADQGQKAESKGRGLRKGVLDRIE